MRKQTPESLDNSMLRRDMLKTLVAGAGGLALSGSTQMLQAATGTASTEEDVAWKQLSDVIAEAADRYMKLAPRPEDPALRAKIYDHTLQMLAIGYMAVFGSDPNKPDWTLVQNNVLPTASPNPDTMYYTTTIDGTGVYRVSGYRGTSFLADLQWGKGRHGVGYPGPRIDSVSLDALERDADGYFELVLSQERPNGHRGNWRHLDVSAASLTLRSVARNWNKELDPRLCIERLDRPARGSGPAPESVASKLGRVRQFMDDWTQIFVGRLPAAVRRGGVNQITEFNVASFGGLAKQFYFSCAFDLAPDEALLIECTAPRKVAYWNMQLTDELFMSRNYVDAQCSLNDFQGKVDRDGKLRVVISLADPGIHNWLDPDGERRGLMLGRWYDSDSTPLPQARVVKLKELRRYLPSDMPVVSATERAEILHKRRQGAQWRRRW